MTIGEMERDELRKRGFTEEDLDIIDDDLLETVLFDQKGSFRSTAKTATAKVEYADEEE